MNIYTNISDFIVIHSPVSPLIIKVNGADVPMQSKEEWLVVVIYVSGERSVLGNFRRQEQAVEEAAEHKGRWLAMNAST